MDCKTALQTILDHVDYTTGACQVNEMVGAVLPKEIILLAKQAIADESQVAPKEKWYLVEDKLGEISCHPNVGGEG